jgi:hypothetical protein
MCQLFQEAKMDGATAIDRFCTRCKIKLGSQSFRVGFDELCALCYVKQSSILDDMTDEAFAQFLSTCHYQSIHLDDTVYYMASQLASSINSNGMLEQIKFLMKECHYSRRDIFDDLIKKDAVNEKGGEKEKQG